MESGRRGTFVAVVGPSGAGKDTLIEGAKRLLAGDGGIVFVRREITRPSRPGDEDHRGLSLEAFAAREAAGAYFLSWRAHGLAYGLPRGYADDVAAGRTVIANLSRAMLDDLRAIFVRTRVVSVTVPAAVLRARLGARGRESDAEIEARLARRDRYRAVGDDVASFVNDCLAEESIAAFADLLRRLSAGA